MKKKVVSLVMVLVMLVSVMPTALAEKITMTEFNNRVNAIQAKYGQGTSVSRIYNSTYGGSACYKDLSGWSSWQCMAWAYYMFDNVWKVSVRSDRTDVHSDVNRLFVGDYVRYRSSDSYDHSIFITKISGNDIYYTDGNGQGTNLIRYNVHTTKSQLQALLNKQLKDEARKGYIRHSWDNGLKDEEEYINIGDKFCANLIQRTAWATIINNNGNVEIGNGVGAINEYWWFERQSDGSYMIESLYDNKYLDVSGAGTSDSTNIQVCVTTGSDAQKWYVKNGKYGYVLVPKHAKSSCLDCATGYPTAGTNVKLWSQNGTEAQGLSIYKQEDWKIENIGDSFCANLIQRTAWATIVNNNGNVEIGNGVGAINEYWWFKRQSDGSYLIKSLYDNKYLDVSSAGTTDDTNIQTCVITGSDAQKWYIKNGAYGLVLVPKHAKTSCLDCATGYPAVGTNVKLWSQNGTQAQGLSIYKQANSPYANIMKNEIKNDDKYYKLNAQFSYITQPATYAAASYTADGQLLDMRTSELASGAQSARATLPKADGAKYIKVFLWDSAEAMNPLAECETIKID